jgi:hypothetical protein
MYIHTNAHKNRTLVLVFIIIGATVILALTIHQIAQATVTCDGNSWSVANETELNDGIACYNAKTIADDYTISFTKNISLTASTNPISNTVSNVALLVDGAGFTIDGQNISDVRPFFIYPNTRVTLQNIIITGGNINNDSGGGIFNQGHLTLNQATVTGNVSDNGGAIHNWPYSNGGIYNATYLTVTNSTINGNTAEYGGGGILNVLSTVIISNTTISDNMTGGSGGGIDNDSGTVILNNSTIISNSATNGDGGGIGNIDSTLTISNSIISNNTADRGGGIMNYKGASTISNSTFNDNSAEYGGGIMSDEGSITISNSTISNNSKNIFMGGGIANVNSVLTINNSTISGNSAEYSGGIYNYGTANISNSTISYNSADNYAGGISNEGEDSLLTLDNSIVANSSNGGDCFNDSGTINNHGYNIVEDNSCGFTGGTDPKLGPLQNNGGATLTHALLLGSPAIDAGDTDLTADQRGITRPQGIADDIGAFEGSYYQVYLPSVQK